MFPNATYRVHQADWDRLVTAPDAVPGAVRKIGPIAPQLEPFSTETELAPGLVARPAPGHTPGSTVYVVADGGERALLLGDVVHAVAELTDPEWHGLYDVDPVAARTVRDRIAEEAAEMGDVIAAAHFPGLKFGRLVTAGSRREFRYL
jgi:glyoxylase-like metal-dependent hydrolase (beta-lactamase superfamily II)